MKAPLPLTRARAAATVASLCALGWSGWAMWSALSVRVSPDVRPPFEAPFPLVADAADDSTLDTLIEDAIDVDPFSAARERPSRRYGTPPEPVVAPAASPAAGPAPLRLLGTVIDADGASFALCQLGGEPPKVLRVGGRIGSHRLTSLQQGVAAFRADDGASITLRVTPFGS